MNVIVICEMSGVVRNAFLAKGHNTISVDLMGTMRKGPHHQGDIFKFLAVDKTNWDLAICFPPCTHLASSGAIHFNSDYKIREQPKAVQFVKDLANLPIPRIAIENPVGVLSSKWRKPDQIIHPYWFGHPETKRTCLWLKNLPKLEETNNVQLKMVGLPKHEKHRIHNYRGPIRLRSMIRSLTYQGVANAMAAQWGGHFVTLTT